MKRKLLLAALCVVGALGMRAQTDVTSTYLTNADFSQTTAVTTDIYGYGKDGTPYGFQAVDGWTSAVTNGDNSNASYPNSGMAAGVLAYGSSNTLRGGQKGAPATNPDGQATGNCFGFVGVWGCGGYYYQTVTLAAGAYTITVPMYNQSGTQANTTYTGFFPTSGTNRTVAVNPTVGSWANQTVSFTLNEATEGQIRIGYQSSGSGSGANPHIFIDCVKIECSPFATSSDYDALNAAISSVEAKAWGFDAGEYAPYNYVEVLEALATAKTIDQTTNNSQVTVQALTATLNTSMTANDEEVNAIWDGGFAHDYSSLSGNVQPYGWYRVTGTYSGDGYNVRYVTIPDGVTESNHGLFGKFTMMYGEQPGYSLPLNSGYYTLSFSYGGYGETGTRQLKLYSGDNNATFINGATTITAKNASANSSTDAYTAYSSFVNLPVNGDYILSFYRENTTSQNQIAIVNLILKQTTVDEATTYYDNLKTTLNADYEAGVYGGNEKTAFKSALDAAVPSTVTEIMAAAAALQTKHDTYVAAKPSYAKFVTEKKSAIEIGVTSEAADAVTMTTADGLDDALHALYVLEDAAATSGYAVDATTLFGNWTTQNMDTKTGEHWSDNASTSYFDRWQNSGFTSSISSTVTLPAGKYVFKLAARAPENSINGAFNMSVKVGNNDAVSKDFVAKGSSGKGIDTSGAANYGDGNFTNNGNGRGWEWRFIGFELNEEASVEMKGYAQIYANNWVGFSDATLLTTSDNVGVLKNLLNAELTTAAAINTTSNVGEEVFQIPSSAVTTFAAAKTAAQAVYNNADATSAQVSAAISALQSAEETYKNTVNAPDASKHYNIIVATTGHAKNGNAVIVVPGEATDNNPTGYALNANFAPNVNLAQAVTFTQVSGNTYNISFETADGTAYLTYGTTNGSAAGWSDSQIQATTEASNKGEFKIVATSTDNVFNIVNTLTNTNIDCQDGGNIYTDEGITLDGFSVAEASQATVNVSIADDVKYGTRIFPFAPDPTLLSGVTAYSCTTSESEAVLDLVEVTTLAANTPYILYAESGLANTDLTGWGTASATKYTDGSLTGVYAQTDAPVGSYVLQKNKNYDNKVGFYEVVDGKQPKVGAYRAYLTDAVATANTRAAFFFPEDSEATAIEGLDVLTSGSYDAIYTANGVQVQSLQKGLNIVKKGGKSYKIMVK